MISSQTQYEELGSNNRVKRIIIGFVKSRSNIETSFVGFLLFLSFYYFSYRYPFQINSSLTSPTYKDTPFILQVLKYVLFLWGIYFTSLKAFANRLKPQYNKEKMFFFFVYLYLFIIPVTSGTMAKSSYLIETGIFFIALLPILLFSNGNLDAVKVSRSFSLFLWVSILYEIVQIALFIINDRLPALAYSNSWSVRFGSVWDDPNSFSFILAFLIPFVVLKKGAKIEKIFVVSFLLVALMLTQSLTGIAGVFASLFLGTFLINIVKPRKSSARLLFLIVILYSIGAIMCYILYLNSPQLQNLWYLKQDSINAHLNIIDTFYQAGYVELMGFNPQGMHGESGYINILLNFGIIYLIVYLLVQLIVIVKLLKIIKGSPKEGSEIYYGALFFVISFALGMTNLPLDVAFPINLAYIICVIFVYTFEQNES
ncbi:hypothetical protein L1N85_15190 [Paenibacillus alkaliterrae]|nr:hypothetical protein [Paenibacillus alkaliterrae]MCF2939764.1 hypothetical protein [Paenibacillus alkaliterrae]